MGVFDRLKQGLSRTTRQFADRLDDLMGVGGEDRRVRPIDVDSIGTLEEILLTADVGMSATARILDAVTARMGREDDLRAIVKAEILAIFDAVGRPAPDGAEPHVTLVVGVNGTGKTTTVGKLARLVKSAGGRPVVCAADTFRAAAAEQLAIWAERAGVPLVRGAERADPAAVVFDAIAQSRARGFDTVIVDTAGRLHTRVNLMQELAKIRRVAGREVAGAPHDVLLVLDATVGQNGVVQAREFTGTAGVNGVVLTKLDGTAKGGVAVAIAHDLKLPITHVGVGEGLDDLLPFDPRAYVDALFEEKW